MKNCVRKEIFVGVLIISVILGMAVILHAGGTEKNGGTDYAETQDAKDGYKYESHAPIYIDGNDDFVVGQNGVVSGNGTESNPYIIEGWDINASSADGIYIRNTDVYFIVRNCYIHDGKSTYEHGVCISNGTNGTIDSVTSYNNNWGITVSDANMIVNCLSYNNFCGISLSSNNTVINCVVYGNTNDGFYLQSSSDNQITNSTIYDNYYGIDLCSSSNNTITNCDIHSNSYGIYLTSSSNNNILANCNVYSNSEDGIYFWNSSCNKITNCIIGDNYYGVHPDQASNNNNIITSCVICNNYYGICIGSFEFFEFPSDNNQITSCDIHNNSYGVSFGYSSDNQIIDCNITDNTNYGVYIYYDSYHPSNFNIFYHNNFVNNSQNAYDPHINYWNNTLSEGNYWDDFDEPSEGAYDNNTDGIVDTPYAIPGGSNVDNFPFMEPSGWEKPELTSHDPIYINGNSQFIVGQNGVTSGNGTQADPYIIENWDINASIAHGIHIENTDVYFIIRNCVIHDGKSNYKHGIFSNSVRNGEIDNITSYNNNYGFYLYSSSNNTITDSAAYNNLNEGVLLDCSSDNYIISCTIYNNLYGIRLNHCSNNTLIGNTLTDNSIFIWWGDIEHWVHNIDETNTVNGRTVYYFLNQNNITINGWETGQIILANCTGFIIKNVEISDSDMCIEMGFSTNITITNCTIYSNKYGIRFYNSVNNTLTNCKIYDSEYEYVYLAQSSNNTIRNCDIYNTPVGILIGAFSYNNTVSMCNIYNNYHGIYLYSSSNNEIHYNNIYSNTNYGVYNYNSESQYEVTATYNWWGSADGPSSAGLGSGDAVSDNVLFDPWLTEPWEEVTASVHNIDKDTYYDTIQEAIDDADAGNTIEVSAGVYYENVVVDKTLTLIGEDRNNTIIDGGGTGDVVYISADWVNVSGFGVKNGSIGIRLWHTSSCNISGNNLFYNLDCGLFVHSSTENIISYNNISSNFVYSFALAAGIYLEESSYNNFENNIISSNADSGISLWNSFSNSFLNNLISTNEDYGIFMYSSIANDITHCSISNNGLGIYSIVSSNNNIANCAVYNNSYYGIHLDSSLNNNITNCTVHNNSDGIWFEYSSNNNITNCAVYNNINTGICHIFSDSNRMTNCAFYYNEWGVYFTGTSSNNQIINCVIHNNSYGAYFFSSSNNIITHCDIIDNTDCGIYLYYHAAVGASNYNFFHHNNFIDNAQNVYDNHTNFWDNGISEGNYWSDYRGCDLDGDGIGDDPYYILGGDNKDNYPLIEPVGTDTIKPKITITGVENNTYYNTNVTTVITIFDLNLNTTTITLNGADFTSGTMIIKDGTYTLFVQATDKINNKAEQTVTFTIDKTPPTISLVLPDNNSVIKTGTVLDFNIVDVNLWKASYSVNGGVSQPFSSPYNISTMGWSDGIYNITVYAKDWGMNENTETFRFTIDSMSPNINITGIINGSYYNTNVTLFIIISDAHLNKDKTIITLDNTSFISGVMVSSEGKYTLYVYAVDTAGNSASQTIIFTIDKTKSNITISGVVDGIYYNADVVPVIDVSDTNLNTTSITLNGNPFTNGTTISIENTYMLVVQAVDKAGNTANKTITFIIDKTAPTITIAESSQTTHKNSFTMSWSASENVQCYEISTDGVNWVNVSTDTQHTFTLSKGDNTLYVRGTDNAGNKGTADMITVTYKKEEGKPGIIPGFETATFLVVLGICIILLRRKLS